MTTQTTIFSLDAIDAALAAAAPSLDEDEQRLAAIVLRLLAAGEPVSIPAAAAVAGMPGPRAEQVLVFPEPDRLGRHPGPARHLSDPHRVSP